MTREDLAVARMTEGWDNVIILASRCVNGSTEMFRCLTGNGYAIQQMLEDELDSFIFIEEDDEDYGEE